MGQINLNKDYMEKYGFHEEEKAVMRTPKGLNENIIREISKAKEEPQWMLDLRLKAYKIFLAKELPTWGGDLSGIDYDNMTFYLKPSDRNANKWEDVPEEIKRTFDRLGIPEAEQKFLGGVGAQYESEAVYHSLKEDLAKQGVLFCDMDTAVKEHPEIVKKYFGTVIPAGDNKFAALNGAVWSGGSFVYIPKGVEVTLPLQAYFRINAKNMGQFERTLIIAEEGAEVHYIEGCTAPVYSSDSLHGAVVEVIAHKNSKIRYTTIQNWSGDVYNLVTKRAFAYENSTVEWIDGNLGCLTSDTKIFLNSDIKRIADIIEGDTVFSVNNNFKLGKFRINGLKYSGKQKIYKLTTKNHRMIRATANHPFLSLQKRGKFSFLGWIPLECLKAGDQVAISGKLPDCGETRKIKFSKIGKKDITIPSETSDDLLWLLGVYIGDGYCDNNRVYFAVPEGDKACAGLVRILKDLFNIEGERKGVVLRVASIDLVKFFTSTLGLQGVSGTKRIPQWIYRLPNSQRKAFIEGYVAADGHYRDNHKNMSITSNNEELLEDTKRLAMSCGLNPTKISTWTRREKKPLGIEEKEYTHHFLYFGEDEFKEDIALVPVTEIAADGEEDAWDIEVDGAHNFVADGFVVHNSKLTMKYPAVYLKGRGAKADILSVAYAGKGQHQDAGAKVIHLAPDTQSRIVSKSVSKDGGRSSYRGLVKVAKGATGSTASVQCDALLLDDHSRSDTYPTNKIEEKDSTFSHEAYVGKVGEEQLFYLMSRGLNESEALAMIVLGFIAEFTKELPMEYSIELNKLIRLEMEDSIG